MGFYYGFGFFLLLLHVGSSSNLLPAEEGFRVVVIVGGGTNLVFAESEIVDFTVKNLVGLV